ncbi:MAG: hypothetical protein LM523_02690 [Candidatus Contendobacter sp.]|nr:hypothetical protein [Candidatus Contendobacter sp.]
MFPKPIYEILPYAYLLIGVFGLTSLESGWGKVCGVALIISGVIVQQIRACYRSEERRSQKAVTTHESLHAEWPAIRSRMESPSRRSIPDQRSVRTAKTTSVRPQPRVNS